MKKFCYSLLIALFTFFSCTSDKTPYEFLTANKTIEDRIAEINKTEDAIRQSENKNNLSKEDSDYVGYEYQLDDNNHYNVAYFFDDAGCFEVGIDTYFQKQEDIQLTKEEIIKVIENLGNFEKAKTTNDLTQWNKTDKSLSIELNCKHITDGMISFTVFANV